MSSVLRVVARAQRSVLTVFVFIIVVVRRPA